MEPLVSLAGGRKNSNKKDSGEDSDHSNSETEDGPLSPVPKCKFYVHLFEKFYMYTSIVLLH